MGAFLKRFAMFGVPGLALFVFLYLMDRFSWSFDQISGVWAAIIAILFIIVVAGVTLCAIYWIGVRRADALQNAERQRQNAERHQVADARTKAIDDAKKLSKAKGEKLIATIDNRIATLQMRIRDLEKDAYRAIEQDNRTLGQDVSAQMTRTVTSSLKELGETVQAEIDNASWGRFWPWLLGLIGGGIAISLAAFSSAISDAFKTDDRRGPGST
jgi:predicted membrane-bound mannosyltransferase